MELFSVKGYQILLAFLLDLIIGDPPWFPHPIKGIGKIINLCENFIRKWPYLSDRIKGVIFFFSVNFLVFGILFLVLLFLIFIKRFSLLLYEALFIFISSLFLATKGLIEAGLKVERALSEGKINEAREWLKALVGRDTEILRKDEIRRAVLESYAENLNDGIIAPLFWFFFFGFPGLVFYKTVNTLDSMVGYKDKKYKEFGWFSAKMDDLLNYLPARITAFLLIFSSFLYFGISNGLRALQWTFKYASKHPSVNSGYPESALAGALGVRLLGPAYYGGLLVKKPYIGENLLTNLSNSIYMAKNLIYLSSFLMVILILLLKGFG